MEEGEEDKYEQENEEQDEMQKEEEETKKKRKNMFPLCTYQCYPGGGGAGGGRDFDILSKIFVKNHSPGTTYFVKKTQNPHPRAGELCQMFLPRGKLFILGIHRDQTRQKNCTSLSLRKTEIILPINSTKSNSHKY